MALTYEIEEYGSGTSLLDHMDQKEPGILFLDIEMPGMGGMDTARALRNLEKKMLIIFITLHIPITYFKDMKYMPSIIF